VNKIISGTPEKRIHNAYNSMKENYNEVTAQGFKNVYSIESVADILDNSRVIFSEAYYGCDFYESVISNSVVPFTRLRDEYDKVKVYYTEHSENMGKVQKEKYSKLLNVLESRISESGKSIMYATYVKDSIDSTFEDELMEAMYEYNTTEEKDVDKIINIMEHVADPLVYFLYAPYVMESLSNTNDEGVIASFAEKYVESKEVNADLDTWGRYVDKVLCCNNLSCDSAYTEAVSYIPRNERFIFKHYMKCNLYDDLQNVTESVIEKSKAIYATPMSAVNNIFTDIFESESYKEENDEVKSFMDNMRMIALESSLNILVNEYQNTGLDTTSIAEGYSVLSESGKSLSEAYDMIISEYTSLSTYMSESEDYDDDEEDYDDIIDSDEGKVGKKFSAPKERNLATKIQNKAMDKEAQYYKKKSIANQKGQDIKNAVRAVGQVPMNIMKSIKEQIHMMDEKDDLRRKKFLAEPGFRKKAFHNLKLAILYGTTATVSLALMPVTLLARHYSKQKDRRVRNELIKEIETEIKITDEKITDASGEGDRQ
jgi:hypothetical protein